MASPDLVPGYLAATRSGALLDALHEIYDSLDAAVLDWQRRSGLSCPAGCGACCARYEPWVLSVEGLAVAAYAALGRHRTVSVLEGDTAGESCVFFDAASPHHCTIYPARPLECRVFAFCATRDKSGGAILRLCRHMPATDRAAMGAEALRARYGSLPPIMEDYSTRLLTLTDGQYRPLRDQARSGWRTVGLIRGLAADT